MTHSLIDRSKEECWGGKGEYASEVENKGQKRGKIMKDMRKRVRERKRKKKEARKRPRKRVRERREREREREKRAKRRATGRTGSETRQEIVRATGFRESSVIQGRRIGSPPDGFFVHRAIDLICCDSGDHHSPCHI